jgi:anti-anti-sigma factor
MGNNDESWAMKTLKDCFSRCSQPEKRGVFMKPSNVEFKRDDKIAATMEELPTESAIHGRQGSDHACIIESRRAGQDTTILDVRGVLTATCEKDLLRAFDEGMAATKKILLNLSGLVHMDVEGAGLLLINASQAARNQVSLSACGLTGPVRDVFHLMGLDGVMAIYEDEKEALCGWRAPEKSSFSVSRLPTGQALLLPGWAKSGDRLSMTGIPSRVMNINVHGRWTSGPAQGFGRLWEKRYRLRLHDTDLEPRRIISLWRSEFPDFWPKGNRLFTSGNAPIAPGTSALLNLTLPGGLVLATGLMVIYAADRSFSFMTAEGHILSGWITFSSFRKNDSTFIQVHPLFRAGDPLMELGLRWGAAAQEDRFWHETLGNLARRLGSHGDVAQQNVLIDPRIQWKRFANLRHSAAIRSSLYMPLYLLKKYFVAKKDRNRDGEP